MRNHTKTDKKQGINRKTKNFTFLCISKVKYAKIDAQKDSDIHRG